MGRPPATSLDDDGAPRTVCSAAGPTVGCSSAARPSILDCDPGHDDAVAIVVAARHTDLLGITTVGGNAPLDRTTYNALVVRDLLDLDVPVHSGAARPLVEPARHQPGCPR